MPGTKVLVIDDERMIRWSIEETLREVGYDVCTAETATEGMALFRQFTPKVVFLDLRLPDDDGITLLRKMKERKDHNTAVIMMTAYEGTFSAAEAKRLGAYEYLKKPFDFQALKGMVARAVNTTNTRRRVGNLLVPPY